MNRVWQPVIWGCMVVTIAAVVLLPGLGSYGFWEPKEMSVAQAAIESAELVDDESPKTSANTTETPPQTQKPSKPQTSPNQTDRIIAASIKTFGASEWSSRLPLALLGLTAILFVFILGTYLCDSSVGLIASLVCLASPLLIFQSRQLQSDIDSIAGQLIFAVGLAGLCLRPSHKGRAWPILLLSLILLGGGGWIAWQGAGLVAGCMPPLLAATLGGLIVMFDGSKSNVEIKLRRQILMGTLFTLIGSVLVILLAKQSIGLFAEALDSKSPSVYSSILGGVWNSKSNGSLTFNQMFESIAFGLGPWIALAPLACLMLLSSGQNSRERWAISFLFLWVAFSWSIGTYLEFRVGPQSFLAFPAVGLLIGLWLQKTIKNEGVSATPLIALFIGISGIVIAKDIAAFPEKLLGIHLDAFPKEFPEGPKTYRIAALLMAVFSIFIALGIGLRNATFEKIRPQQLQKLVTQVARFAIPFALLTSLIFSLFLAHVWPRQLDERLSSRKTFDTLKALRLEGESFAMVGHSKKGAAFYAGNDYKKLTGRKDLITYLKQPERNYALIRTSELCPLYKQSRKDSFNFYVVDDSNPDFMLLSNRMFGGSETLPQKISDAMRHIFDRNALPSHVVDKKPTLIETPLNINYDGKIELVGTSIPKSVPRGDEFEAVLVYKVLKPISRDWKVFLHFDGPVRFQGDHDPLDGDCGTRYWVPGDYMIDRTKVKAGSFTDPKTTYTMWTGLFSGSAGNWTNMKTTHPAGDEKHRVKIGTINLE